MSKRSDAHELRRSLYAQELHQRAGGDIDKILPALDDMVGEVDCFDCVYKGKCSGPTWTRQPCHHGRKEAEKETDSRGNIVSHNI